MERTRSAYISATIEEVAAADVINHIGKSRYDAIKRRDEHPMFIKLKVAYEGLSHGALTVAGKTVNQAKRWYRACVDELADALNFGSPGLFIGHDNKDSRPRLGEIMGAFATDDDKGRRTASAIAYVGDQGVRPKIKDGAFPKCSVEADILIGGLDTDEPFVQAVEAATAVVLAGPDVRAGFEEAGVEAVIAETVDEIKKGSIDEMSDDKTKKPSELYSRNELLEDPIVKSLIDAGRDNIYTELKDAKKKIEGLEADVKAKEETIGNLKKTLGEAGATANAGRVSAAIDKSVGALKLTAKEKDLIKSRLGRSVKIEDPETSDEDIAAAVEAAAKDAEAGALEFRKIYGKPKDSDDGDNSDNSQNSDHTEDDDDGSDDKDPFLEANKLKPEQVA